MVRVLSGEIDLLADEAGPPLGAVDWWVGESRQGWRGMATLNPVPELRDPSAETVFRHMIEHGVAPGVPIRFGLWGRSPTGYYAPERDSDATFVRSWPSVVTAVHAPCELDLSKQERFGGDGSMILFCDPVTYLLRSRIWGVFKDRSPGELLAGGMMLAAGVGAEPSLRPAIPGLPSITIAESRRTVGMSIPYAIATGETLGEWLGAIFGRLSLRLEMLGDDSGGLHVSLLGGAPAGTRLDLQLGGAANAESALISSLELGPAPPDIESSTVLDNPSIGQPRRIGQTQRVGRVVTATELTFDEAAERAGNAGNDSDLRRSVLEVITGQPGLHAGRVVRFDRSVTGARDWQVHRVEHMAESGRYSNVARLLKLGPWTPLTFPDRGAVIVKGVIYDPEVGEDFGRTVERDAMNRVPARLSFGQGDPATPSGPAGDNGANGAGGDSPSAPPPELTLPVIGPMAGGAHGFVPGHRQGDICAVAVHHPMLAEIVGFSFEEHRSIGGELVDVSMGVFVEGGGDYRDLIGMVFRPAEELEQEERDRKNKKPPPH